MSLRPPSLATLACLTLAGLAPAGCDESIHRGWLVDRTRLLAARVDADADPGRASIAPGERARVTWLVASPGAMPRLSWSFALCDLPPGNYAAPRCESEPLAAGSGTSTPASPSMLVMPLELPARVAETGAQSVLLLSAFCEAGAPTLDVVTFQATCPDGAAPLLGSVEIRLQAAGTNRNPEIPADAITFDGAVLAPPAAAPPPPTCAPAVAPGGEKHRFAFRFDERERESIPPRPEENNSVLETLVLSHVTTAGDLERQYSALDPYETAPKEMTIAWIAPDDADLPAEGRFVDFDFVLRDGRGGTAITRRSICVRRP